MTKSGAAKLAKYIEAYDVSPAIGGTPATQAAARASNIEQYRFENCLTRAEADAEWSTWRATQNPSGVRCLNCLSLEKRIAELESKS